MNIGITKEAVDLCLEILEIMNAESPPDSEDFKEALNALEE